MNNLDRIIKYLSTNNISFLIDFDKRIDIDKKGKAYYFKMFNINLDFIINFINHLDGNEVYLINPLISVNCKQNEPYLTLSRQFLLTNNSNPILVYEYLIKQFKIAQDDFEFNFEFDDGYYFLLFKYKKVYLDNRRIG
jgi:hypothetical protein